MDAEKAMRGIRTYCNREGFGVGHTFTFTVTGNISQVYFVKFDIFTRFILHERNVLENLEKSRTKETFYRYLRYHSCNLDL